MAELKIKCPEFGHTRGKNKTQRYVGLILTEQQRF